MYLSSAASWPLQKGKERNERPLGLGVKVWLEIGTPKSDTTTVDTADAAWACDSVVQYGTSQGLGYSGSRRNFGLHRFVQLVTNLNEDLLSKQGVPVLRLILPLGAEAPTLYPNPVEIFTRLDRTMGQPTAGYSGMKDLKEYAN